MLCEGESLDNDGLWGAVNGAILDSDKRVGVSENWTLADGEAVMSAQWGHGTAMCSALS